jgi:hypothetical protein
MTTKTTKPLTADEQVILESIKGVGDFITGCGHINAVARRHNVNIRKIYGIARRSGEFNVEPMYDMDRHWASYYRLKK